MSLCTFVTLVAAVVLSASVTLSISFAVDGGSEPSNDLALFEIAKLLESREKSKRTYLPFLDRPTLHMGIYHLSAGAKDGQSPHDEDEVYYVLAGKATVEVSGEKRPVAKGSVIYVKAKAEHRFLDITDELTLLVFFSRAKPAVK